MVNRTARKSSKMMMKNKIFYFYNVKFYRIAIISQFFSWKIYFYITVYLLFIVWGSCICWCSYFCAKTQFVTFWLEVFSVIAVYFLLNVDRSCTFILFWNMLVLLSCLIPMFCLIADLLIKAQYPCAENKVCIMVGFWKY